MRFYIEHYECLRGGAWGWVRVAGATATRLREAEEMKKALAKSEAEPEANYSIMVCVEDGDHEIKEGLRREEFLRERGGRVL